MKKRFVSMLLVLALALSLGLTAGAATGPEQVSVGWRESISANSWEALRLTNVERAQEGLQPLSTFEALHAAAQLRAREIGQSFSHTRPNGQSCMTALNDVGLDPYAFTRSGENIAIGYGTPAAVVDGWMHSTGHRMNILTGPFTHLGMGNNGSGWTQMFLGTCMPQVSKITLGAGSYPVGTRIEDMDGVVILTCAHGNSYLPLSPEMCRGYTANAVGEQTVTVQYGSQTFSLDVTIQGTAQEAAAWELYRLGLFQGRGILENGQPDFALDQQCTREEALTMLLRLLGREGEISASDAAAHPFRDVSQWASPYVGFAYRSGIAYGTGADTFSGSNAATVAQELTFVLRALGYQSDRDFQWDAPWNLSDQVGLTSGQYGTAHLNAAISRGEVALLCQAALDCRLAGKTTTLRQDLTDRGVIQQ